MKINKFKAETSTILGIASISGNVHLTNVRKGEWYYSFDTPQKTWIKHSNSLTDQERQMIKDYESSH